MNSRKLIKKIIAKENVDKCGLWVGRPKEETWEIFYKYFNTESKEEIYKKLGDDMRVSYIPSHPHLNDIVSYGYFNKCNSVN